MSLTKAEEIYPGSQELDAMKYAENYNNFIISLIIKYFGANNTIIDFGAGNGLFAKKLKGLGNEVQCIEVDEQLIKEIVNKGLPVEKSLTSFPQTNFVYSLNVLEHIHNDVETLKMIHSFLPQNGKLFLYVPAFQILFSSNDQRVGHVRRYSKKELCDKLVATGFNVEVAEYTDSMGFFCTLIYKLVGSKSGEINIPSLIFFDRFLFPLNRVLDPILKKLLGKNLFVVASKL